MDLRENREARKYTPRSDTVIVTKYASVSGFYVSPTEGSATMRV